ncbi:MAG: glycosyltransferase family 2 protein [Deltaproteobacteria bacterium]|nr:glycosyltransferase family 2 protein [Deltaproteobacteria bacterium]
MSKTPGRETFGGNRVLVIIPAYNEEATVGGVVLDVKKEMPSADIVVVNDGSGDLTAAVAREKGARVLEHPYNMGIGSTMQTGYRYAIGNGYDIAVQVDADGQHPASEIKKLIGPVAEGRADVAVGSRFLVRGDYRPSFMRGVAIRVLAGIVSIILRARITDPTSGFRAAGGNAIEFLSRLYPDDYPEVEALVLLHKKGFAVTEIPVRMAGRKGGRSSITAPQSVYYMVKVLLAIVVDLLKRLD